MSHINQPIRFEVQRIAHLRVILMHLEKKPSILLESILRLHRGIHRETRQASGATLNLVLNAAPSHYCDYLSVNDINGVLSVNAAAQQDLMLFGPECYDAR